MERYFEAITRNEIEKQKKQTTSYDFSAQDLYLHELTGRSAAQRRKLVSNNCERIRKVCAPKTAITISSVSINILNLNVPITLDTAVIRVLFPFHHLAMSLL